MSPLEVALTRNEIFRNGLMAALGLLSVGLAEFLPARLAGLSSFAYSCIGLIESWPPGGTTVTSGWNATFTITSTVSATDAGWNGGIATGAINASVGIQGTWSRSSAGPAPPSPFPQPTDFTLNGVRCTGSTNTFNIPPRSAWSTRPPARCSRRPRRSTSPRTRATRTAA